MIIRFTIFNIMITSIHHFPPNLVYSLEDLILNEKLSIYYRLFINNSSCTSQEALLFINWCNENNYTITDCMADHFIRLKNGGFNLSYIGMIIDILHSTNK